MKSNNGKLKVKSGKEADKKAPKKSVTITDAKKTTTSSPSKLKPSVKKVVAKASPKGKSKKNFDDESDFINDEDDFNVSGGVEDFGSGFDDFDDDDDF